MEEEESNLMKAEGEMNDKKEEEEENNLNEVEDGIQNEDDNDDEDNYSIKKKMR